VQFFVPHNNKNKDNNNNNNNNNDQFIAIAVKPLRRTASTYTEPVLARRPEQPVTNNNKV